MLSPRDFRPARSDSLFVLADKFLGRQILVRKRHDVGLLVFGRHKGQRPHMLLDDILFNVVEREVFSGVGHGDFRMFQAVEFFPGQIRRVVIAPVIEKKVVQKRAPGRGTVIKPEKLADPVRQVGHIVDMAINGGVVMEVILELPEFLMPQNIAHFISNLQRFPKPLEQALKVK